MLTPVTPKTKDSMYWIRVSWSVATKLFIGSWVKVQYDWDKEEIVKSAKSRGQILEWKQRFSNE